MFTYTQTFSSFSVHDLAEAKKFYGGTLGLEVEDEGPGFKIKTTLDGNTVMVYAKDKHAPAVYTMFNFVVDDINEAVDTLTKNGVTFEHYDGFDQNQKGISPGIASGKGPDIAWFKDPAGNILAVMQLPD